MKPKIFSVCVHWLSQTGDIACVTTNCPVATMGPGRFEATRMYIYVRSIDETAAVKTALRIAFDLYPSAVAVSPIKVFETDLRRPIVRYVRDHKMIVDALPAGEYAYIKETKEVYNNYGGQLWWKAEPELKAAPKAVIDADDVLMVCAQEKEEYEFCDVCDELISNCECSTTL